MLPFQRHRERFYDNMPSRGGAMSGGVRCDCGGVCGGARNPVELMEQVMQHVEDGRMSGGQVANVIMDYAGNGMYGEGFFGDLWSGIKSVAKPLASVAKMGLSLVPHPGAQLASHALGALGVGRRKRVVKRKMTKSKTGGRRVKKRRTTRRM
jgi:hypothetical protein